MVLADSHGISRVPRYSGTCPASQHRFRLQDCHLLWPTFQSVRLRCWFVTRRPCGLTGPTTPEMQAPLVWAVPRSLAATSGITDCFLFLRVLRWFTSPRCLRRAYVFSAGYSGMTQSGFPHSEIPGSKPVCGSPRLIAAYHVLHRLLAPRHSPYALSSLTKCIHCSLALALCVVRSTTDCRVFSCQEHCSDVVVRRNYRLQDIQLSTTVRRASLEQTSTLVENTGIEPVTSWLQTRRSPS